MTPSSSKTQSFEVLFIGPTISSDDLRIALTNGLSDLQAQGGLPLNEEWQLEVVPLAPEDAHLG